eukprot:TRINITY_DN2912_c0_g1_i1.p1 TRINITY_DN2912_c0_g1~~TRINITY_DN2912_c0_g1_i1.p1  ORF type:complete len:172 (-),score=3.12 TRINITY_DN2912_c0_g1_i1:328-843(-)
MASSTSTRHLLSKVTDFILLANFLSIAVGAPLVDAQICLPRRLFPQFLVDMKSWYGNEYGDYLVTEKPHFFVGVVWLQLLVQWPLAIANVYGIIRNKSWYRSTCLIYGVSTCSGMAAVLGELMGSDKASKDFFMIYLTFMGLSILAIFRGFIPCTAKITSVHVTKTRKKEA